jgi:hypothetical protein
MIITETLITVATIDSRIINLEKDFCWLKAMRCAIKEKTFTIISYSKLPAANAWREIGVYHPEIASKIERLGK